MHFAVIIRSGRPRRLNGQHYLKPSRSARSGERTANWRLVGGDLPRAQSQIEMLLASAADPDVALHYLVSLKQQRPAAFERLVHSQRSICSI